MAEVMATVLTETETYPFSAFISDTGGAAGLFLGLHALGQYEKIPVSSDFRLRIKV